MGGQSSHVGNIYGVPQPSPDSESFADMKIRSPTSNSQQTAVDGKQCVWTISIPYHVCFSEDVEQISGKIDSISLSGAPGSLSDCISLSLDMQQQHNLFGQVSVEPLCPVFSLAFRLRRRECRRNEGQRQQPLNQALLWCLLFR